MFLKALHFIVYISFVLLIFGTISGVVEIKLDSNTVSKTKSYANTIYDKAERFIDNLSEPTEKFNEQTNTLLKKEKQ
jgi:hypothetical protein